MRAHASAGRSTRLAMANLPGWCRCSRQLDSARRTATPGDNSRRCGVGGRKNLFARSAFHRCAASYELQLPARIPSSVSEVSLATSLARKTSGCDRASSHSARPANDLPFSRHSELRLQHQAGPARDAVWPRSWSRKRLHSDSCPPAADDAVTKCRPAACMCSFAIK